MIIRALLLPDAILEIGGTPSLSFIVNIFPGFLVFLSSYSFFVVEELVGASKNVTANTEFPRQAIFNRMKLKKLIWRAP